MSRTMGKSYQKFDGDEMNVHVPQSVPTVAELLLIANATKRFVSPATSKIAINAKQDTLMGSHLQTQPDIYIDWKDVLNVLMATSGRLRTDIPKNMKLSGKFMYSQIVPDFVNIEKKKDNGDFAIKIRNGVITHGIFNKSEISGIIQKTWLQGGSKPTQHFIDDLQRMILHWLMRYGFTVGIGDTVVPKKVHEEVFKLIETNRKDMLTMITEYENDPAKMTTEAHEVGMREKLKAAQDGIQKAVLASFTNKNGIFIAITSGSSGADMNAGQIVGAIGQVIVERARIPKKFNDRTLPMFPKNDDSMEARGFCPSSFIKGLNPAEFFFHVMSGREGIISTAIKTADKPSRHWASA